MHGFRPDALEAPLAALDALPRALWLPGIINGVGRLTRRLRGLHELDVALQSGGLPPAEHWHWPTDAVLEALEPALRELGLAQYCGGQPELTVQVLRSLLWHLDRIADYRDREPGLPHEAAIARAVAAFRDDWGERCGEMDEFIWVFGDLGDAARSEHWDATRGLLRSEGWREMLRIRALLERLPELRELIRGLGRARQTDEPDASSRLEAEVFEQATEPLPRTREVHIPGLPGETQGIERSGNISRMLASEALLLRHPRLRLIWFARHAERILLTYEDRDTLAETELVDTEVSRPSLEPRPDRRLESGPIVVCIDTSGSMRGACEQVAKAVVLEAMRTALAQRRACHLFAFSGPGEVVEKELGCDAEGIDAAVGFLRQAFHGGTEVSEALDRALDRLAESRWQLADLLIASDGEFGPTQAVVERLASAKRTLGLRVQGVLTGDRETLGMLALCDDVFWVRDWRNLGSGAAGSGSPLDDKSLTRRYFPGALAATGAVAGPGRGGVI